MKIYQIAALSELVYILRRGVLQRSDCSPQKFQLSLGVKFSRLKLQARQLWKDLAHKSINSQILSAAITVIRLAILVKVIAFFKESIVAWQFGTGDDIDAFLIAAIVPDFVGNVVAGSLHAALVTIYIQVREQTSRKQAEKLLSEVIVASLVLCAIATLLMVIAAPFYLPWMTTGFSTEKAATTMNLLHITAPLIVLTGITCIFRAVLHAEEKFALAALTPVLQPAAIIIMLLLFRQSLGAFSLAIGLIIGAVAEIICLGVALHRQGIGLQPKWFGFTPTLQRVARQYLPATMGSLLMCTCSLVDQSMAAALEPGSVAMLNYALRVSFVPLMLGETAIATTAPYFSKMIALANWKGVRHTLYSFLKLIFLITVPLTGFLIFLSEPIIQVLFQRGAFTAQQTHLVAQVFSAFVLQIPFYIAGNLVVKLLTCLSLNPILMWVSLFNVSINVGLNYLFMQYLGIQGIALSTSCVYLFSFLFVLCFALKNLKKFSMV